MIEDKLLCAVGSVHACVCMLHCMLAWHVASLDILAMHAFACAEPAKPAVQPVQQVQLVQRNSLEDDLAEVDRLLSGTKSEIKVLYATAQHRVSCMSTFVQMELQAGSISSDAFVDRP